MIAGRLSARGVECDAEDLDYELVGGSRDSECIIKVAARLAQDVGEELNAVVGDVASSRKVPFQMDDIHLCMGTKCQVYKKTKSEFK